MKRLPLCHLPTPLWRHEALDRLVGAEVWVKRDDMTGGATAGNKLRKLEYLMSDAREKQANVVITCGGVQSNHARTTALVAAELGLSAQLLLRVPAAGGGSGEPSISGNLLLDRLAGAQVRFVTAAEYQKRDELMQALAQELLEAGRQPYIIPEGGSNGLGALGYVDAMAEVRQQLDHGLGPSVMEFDAVVCACGSGGTAAGVALGIARWGVARRAVAIAVCDDAAYFESKIEAIMLEARRLNPTLPRTHSYSVEDAFKGPGYGVASEQQLSFLREVCRHTGLTLDPVYTGKALFGLAHMQNKPRTVLFLHTGGLPGLLAQAPTFDAFLSDEN